MFSPPATHAVSLPAIQSVKQTGRIKENKTSCPDSQQNNHIKQFSKSFCQPAIQLAIQSARPPALRKPVSQQARKTVSQASSRKERKPKSHCKSFQETQPASKPSSQAVSQLASKQLLNQPVSQPGMYSSSQLVRYPAIQPVCQPGN